MAPIFLLLIVALVLTSTIGGAFREVANGGSIGYDEKVFQQYADREYAKAFGSSSAYEDHLLIVVLTNEECDGYYCIAWIGDNVKSEIKLMFGDESTAFGQAITSSINSEYYAYSLDSNLASAVNILEKRIGALGLQSAFLEQNSHANVPTSHVVNYTDLAITESTVNTALESFTDTTGISTVIVVETMEAVFGKTLPLSSIIIVVAAIALAVVAIWMIVRAIRNRKNGGNGKSGGNPNDGYQNNGPQSERIRW